MNQSGKTTEKILHKSLLGVLDSDSRMCSNGYGDNGVGEDYVPYDSDSGDNVLR